MSRIRNWKTGFLIVAVLLNAGCATSGARRMDSSEEVVSDSGTLTRQELEEAAKKMAASMGTFIQKKRPGRTTYVALLPAKNDTSEILPLNAYDNALIGALRTKDVATVRIKTREMALKELSFAQSGMTSNTLSVGSMAVPNFS